MVMFKFGWCKNQETHKKKTPFLTIFTLKPPF